MLKFFDWAYSHGAQQASELDYAALPDTVTTRIRAAWKTELKGSDGKAIW